MEIIQPTQPDEFLAMIDTDEPHDVPTPEDVELVKKLYALSDFGLSFRGWISLGCRETKISESLVVTIHSTADIPEFFKIPLSRLVDVELEFYSYISGPCEGALTPDGIEEMEKVASALRDEANRIEAKCVKPRLRVPMGRLVH